MGVSPQGDAGLPDHLGAQVLGRQLERRLHEPQLLQEAVELGGAGQEQRADLLQLGKEEAGSAPPSTGAAPEDEDVRLQPPLAAPSPVCRRTARPESWSWPPPPPCWSRSEGDRTGQRGETSRARTEDLWDGGTEWRTCTAGTSSKAWMKSSSSTAPAPEPSLPAGERVTVRDRLASRRGRVT